MTPEDDESQLDLKATNPDEFKAFTRVLTQVLELVQQLNSEYRNRLFRALEATFDMQATVPTNVTARPPAGSLNVSGGPPRAFANSSHFSEDRSLSPKQFMFEKRPQTDVERMACLAYYLTHYRDTPHFKTLELSKLNTEAAQVKFSNAAKAVDNATRSHLLVPVGQAKKQLSVVGELYVQALPDRTAAREALASAAGRQRRRNKARSSSTPSNGNEE
jgi:hypothetical protein